MKLLLFHIYYNIVNMTSEIILIVVYKVLDTLTSYFHENSFQCFKNYLMMKLTLK